MQKLLVQAYERFGDNLCCAGAISQIKDAEIIVCTNKNFASALYNIPNVQDLIYMDDSSAKQFAQKNKYTIIDITLSRIHAQTIRLDARVPLHLKNFGYDYIKNGPAFFPTQEELDWAEEFYGRFKDKPLVGVESAFNSGQGYINKTHCDKIVEKYWGDYHILWLCNTNYPSSKEKIVDMGEFNCRQICTIMPKLSIFVSSFSGYYWGSRCWEKKPKTYLLTNDYFKNWTKHENLEIVLQKDFGLWATNND